MRVNKLFIIVFCLSLTVNFLFAEKTLPDNQQEVYTSVEGNVNYYVKKGETVEKGKPLFFIKRNDIPPEEIAEKKHELDYAADEYSRRNKLIKTHSVSEQEYEDSKIAKANAKDELNITKAEVALGLYKAPYNCKVIKLLFPQGSGIGDGSPVIVIQKIKNNNQPVKN